MGFLPKNYEAPRGSANYMKFVAGENRIRILSKPILGWEDWQDKKPIRYRYDRKPAQSIDPKHAVRHFWAMIVWNYSQEMVQVLQITQAEIRNSLEVLYKDSDWGAPFFYDVKIVKTGEGKDSKYTVNPMPHKPTAQAICEAFRKKPCYLEALYENGDPFASHEDITQGVFTQADLDEQHAIAEPEVDFLLSPIDELKEHMNVDGIDVEYLEAFLQEQADKKKVPVEKLVQSALSSTATLAQYKTVYAKEVAKRKGA